ncbi:hypothetical protein [Streptomyces venezuelae]|uniref:hypothetical protein n=1 Tax=Streptomyces venezuelae TaxID=54571 RepID=UPI00278BEE53|nr:hypothetical protein [Streptomyces venezuelae]
MTPKVGQRVKLAVEVAWPGEVTTVGAPEEPGVAVGFLSLAAGVEGTVEEVTVGARESHEVREYVRLSSLLDDFGHQMPPESRSRLAEQVAALEPEWTAFQERGLRATLRVRLDNGFVLRDTSETVFTPA